MDTEGQMFKSAHFDKGMGRIASGSCLKIGLFLYCSLHRSLDLGGQL